ncbi:MAG: hypothetical protein IJ722_04795 [Alloprevotella sp.]|nr:hypothetical protein [Alloprevotella sp.]
MARPIEETPILYGKDAERFLKGMANVKPATKEERAKAKKAFEWMRSIATFAL